MDPRTTELLAERARRLAVPLREPEGAGDGAQVLSFAVGDARYAVPVASVAEARDAVRPEPVPELPDWIAGVIGVRGRVVPAVRVDAFLRGGRHEDVSDERPSAIVVAVDGIEVAVLADALEGILPMPAEGPAAIPAGAPETVRACALGFVEGRLVVDPVRFVSAMQASLPDRQRRASASPTAPEE